MNRNNASLIFLVIAASLAAAAARAEEPNPALQQEDPRGDYAGRALWGRTDFSLHLDAKGQGTLSWSRKDPMDIVWSFTDGVLRARIFSSSATLSIPLTNVSAKGLKNGIVFASNGYPVLLKKTRSYVQDKSFPGEYEGRYTWEDREGFRLTLKDDFTGSIAWGAGSPQRVFWRFERHSPFMRRVLEIILPRNQQSILVPFDDVSAEDFYSGAIPASNGEPLLIWKIPPKDDVSQPAPSDAAPRMVKAYACDPWQVEMHPEMSKPAPEIRIQISQPPFESAVPYLVIAPGSAPEPLSRDDAFPAADGTFAHWSNADYDVTFFADGPVPLFSRITAAIQRRGSSENANCR